MGSARGAVTRAAACAQPSGNVAPLTLAAASLTGSGAMVTLATVVPGNVLSGTFTLSINAEVTAPLAFDASDVAVAQALGALASVGAVTVVRTGPTIEYGYDWTITFVDDMNAGQVAAMTASGVGLSGVGATVVACNDAVVVAGTPCGASSSVDGNQFTGNFKVLAGGVNLTLSVDATAASFAAALATVSGTIGTTSVSRSDPDLQHGYTWTITYTSKLGLQPLLTAYVLGNAVGATYAIAHKSAGTVQEVQQIVTTASAAIGGSFSIGFNGANTTAITVGVSCTATGTAMQSALNSVATIGTVAVTVTAGPTAQGGCTWSVSFVTHTGALPLMRVYAGSATSAYTNSASSVTSGTLTPASATATVSRLTAGTSSALGGLFTMSFAGQTTGYLPYASTSAQISDALQALSTIDRVTVVRSNADVNNGYTWTITFIHDMTGPLPYITVDTASLTGTLPVATVVKATTGVAPPFISGPGGLSLGAAVVTDMSNLAYRISGLREGVPYTARVLATNAIGTGLPSVGVPALISPLPQPPGAPLDVTLTGVDASTLAVRFNPPADEGGVKVDSYKIDYATSAILDDVQVVTLNVPVQQTVQTVTTSATTVFAIHEVVTFGTATGVQTNEVQRVACDASGGTFAIIVANQRTNDISWSSTAAQVQAALVALSNVGTVTVAISGGQTTACAPSPSANYMSITFDAINGVQGYRGDVPLVSVDVSQLAGNRNVNVTVITQGIASVAGSFTLAYAGSSPTTITSGSSAVTVASALNALSTIIAAGGVSVSLEYGPDSAGGYGYLVTFNFAGDAPAMVASGAQLLGNGAGVVVCVGASSLGHCHGTSRYGNVLGGSFTLTLMGWTTRAITFNAANTDMKAALEDLPNIGTVNVVRSGPTAVNGYVWTVTFVSNPGDFPPGSYNVATLVGSNVALTGTGASAVGAPVTTGSTPASGTFTITFNSLYTTPGLAYDVSRDDMKAALESLTGVGRVVVARDTTATGYTWAVTFSGCQIVGGIDVCNRGVVPQLGSTSSVAGGYTGNPATVTVSITVIGVAAAGSVMVTDLSAGPPFVASITLLTTGVPVYVRVASHNGVAYGPRALTVPNSLAPAFAVPGEIYAPVLVNSTASTITLGWTAPLATGGTPITGYQLFMDTWEGGNWRLVYDGTGYADRTAITLASQLVLNGVRYQFRVAARNLMGTGALSPASSFSVRTPTAPLPAAAPVRDPQTSEGLSSVAGDAVVAFTWALPIDNGGSLVTDFEVYIDDGLNGAFTAATPAPLFGQAEVQTISVGGTSGSFAITYAGNSASVSWIAGGPTTTTVQTAIETLSGVGAVDVQKSGSGPYVYTITFFTSSGDMPPLGLDTSSLAGTTGTGVATTSSGIGTPEVRTVETSVSSGTVGGSFTLTLSTIQGVSVTTGAIAYNAAAATVQTAIESAFATASVTVTVLVSMRVVSAPAATQRWYIMFSGGWASQMPLTAFSANSGALTGTGATTILARVVSNSFTHVARGRIESRPYRAFVKAVNVLGRSSRSPLVTVWSASVPGAASSVQFTDIGPQAISLRWAYPAATGGSPITGYKTYMFPGVAPNTQLVPVPVVYEVQTIATLAAAPVSEIQTVTTTGTTGGTFRLGFGNAYTVPIAYNAAFSAVSAALATIAGAGAVSGSVGGLVNSGYTWSITFALNGPQPLLFIDTSALQGASKTGSVARPITGAGTIAGDFTVAFQGVKTGNLPYDISASEMARQLMLLPGTGVISVTRSVGSNGGLNWAVSFLSNVGNQPAMTVTNGRLTGSGVSISVTETVPGTTAVLVYDGTGAPSVEAFTATGLTQDTTYAFAVSPLNAVGAGVPGAATLTVVARSGSDPSHVYAVGSPLSIGMTGSVFEVQQVSVYATSGLVGTYTLALGAGGTSSGSIEWNAAGSSVASALTGLAYSGGTIGAVVATRVDLVGGVNTGYTYLITFANNLGNMPLLTYVSSLTGTGTGISVVEYIQGAANSFSILPRKASGTVVTDIDSASGFVGSDVFFTELWSSAPTVFDGTQTWISDNGVASYSGVVYEVQRIRTTGASALSGTFSVTVTNLDGVSGTTSAISYSASANVVKSAIDALNVVGTVTVSVTQTSVPLSTYDWFVTFTSYLGPVPSMTNGAVALGGGSLSITETQVGVAEVQVITTSSDLPFTREIQSITTSTTSGTISGSFTIQVGTSAVVSFSATSSAAQLQTTLQSLSTVKSVTTNRIANPDGSANGFIWTVTYVDPVGDVPNIVVALSTLTSGGTTTVSSAEVVKGYSPLAGTFLVQFKNVWSGNVPFDASASAMEAALELVSTVGNVHVTRSDVLNGHEWRVTFLTNLGAQPMMNVYPIRAEIQSIAITGGTPTPLGGTFTLTFGGSTTIPLSFDVSADGLKAALEALPTVGDVETSRTGPTGQGQYSWQVSNADCLSSLLAHSLVVVAGYVP